MTYFEIVDKIRDTYEYGDARNIFEHIAIQVNIVGEGSGALYIEVAQRSVCVEPYDYYDRDGLITADAKTICEICDGTLTFDEAIKNGRLTFEGNINKLRTMKNIEVHRTK